MRLGSLRGEVRRALLSAFPGYGALDVLVSDANMHEDGVRILFAHFQPPQTRLDVAIENLLQWVEAHDYVVEFLRTAERNNPHNQHFRKVLTEVFKLEDKCRLLGANESDVRLGQFERLVFNDFTFADAAIWLDDMMKMRRAVCRIEPQAHTSDPASLNGYGTGFLIGPDVVMTNDHVASAFYENPSAAAKVICRFDLELSVSGEARAGVPYTLHPTEWRVIRRSQTELDFAICRLAECAGDEELEGGDARGFLTPAAYRFQPHEGLVIFQHPQGARLKLALGAVDGEPWPQNRVAYQINTEPGSSGSPCITQTGALAAIHHQSDMSVPRNYGVRMSAILESLARGSLEEQERLSRCGLARLCR